MGVVWILRPTVTIVVVVAKFVAKVSSVRRVLVVCLVLQRHRLHAVGSVQTHNKIGSTAVAVIVHVEVTSNV